MTITAVETQKKRTDRVSVYIDGEFAFGMDSADALYYKLKPGEEIDADKYAKIMDELILTKAKDYAMKYLGYRARTEKEMREYLWQKEFGESVIDEVVQLLYKYKYLDDYAFAKSFISDSFKFKKWGDLKIKYELGLKGVSSKAIAQAMEENDADKTEIIISLIMKRVGDDFDSLDEKEKYKTYSYLKGRGFLYDDIETAVSVMRDN